MLIVTIVTMAALLITESIPTRMMISAITIALSMVTIMMLTVGQQNKA